MPLIDVPQKAEVFIEAAAVSQLRNNVRVPGNGSDIDLRSLIGAGAQAGFRVWGLGRIDIDSGWRFVIAPLRLSGTGRFDEAKEFNGETFAAGVDTKGNYRFDSYRLTYWRRARGDSKSSWRFGYTLKIRDAEVSLSQPGVRSTYRNTGIVPLLHFGGTRDLGGGNELLIDFDGLIAPQGSALDLGIYFRRNLSEQVGAIIGVRGLYGGADNAKTYNIAAVGYLTAGLSYRF